MAVSTVQRIFASAIGGKPSPSSASRPHARHPPKGHPADLHLDGAETLLQVRVRLCEQSSSRNMKSIPPAYARTLGSAPPKAPQHPQTARFEIPKACPPRRSRAPRATPAHIVNMPPEVPPSASMRPHRGRSPGAMASAISARMAEPPTPTDRYNQCPRPPLRPDPSHHQLEVYGSVCGSESTTAKVCGSELSTDSIFMIPPNQFLCGQLRSVSPISTGRPVPISKGTTRDEDGSCPRIRCLRRR